MGFEFKSVHFGGLEHNGVIEETDVHTTTIRTFEEDRFEATTVFGVGFGTEVIETADVLYFGYTDTSGTARVIIRTELGNGISHVFDFVLILVSRPFHTAVREVFIVVFTFVMDGVEEVFQVVERDTAHMLAAFSRLCSVVLRFGCNGEHERRRYEILHGVFHMTVLC